ncbi:hypothetical protein BLA29_015048, partial [Euroglyphus maynei]
MPFIQAIRKWVENEKRKLKFERKRERRQQMKLAKQEKRKASKSADNVDFSTTIGAREDGSNSSSPTSTIEDMNDNK